MTTKLQTIDKLVQLSARVAKAWLKNPKASSGAITNKAILAVCKHLSHEASYRTDIAELIRMCRSAAVSHEEKETQVNHASPASEAIGKALTQRQIEILQLFARGLSHQEVGAQLNVTPQTVKNYASAIFIRLGVKNKSEAVLEARVLGFEI